MPADAAAVVHTLASRRAGAASCAEPSEACGARRPGIAGCREEPPPASPSIPPPALGGTARWGESCASVVFDRMLCVQPGLLHVKQALVLLRSPIQHWPLEHTETDCNCQTLERPRKLNS